MQSMLILQKTFFIAVFESELQIFSHDKSCLKMVTKIVIKHKIKVVNSTNSQQILNRITGIRQNYVIM